MTAVIFILAIGLSIHIWWTQSRLDGLKEYIARTHENYAQLAIQFLSQGLTSGNENQGFSETTPPDEIEVYDPLPDHIESVNCLLPTWKRLDITNGRRFDKMPIELADDLVEHFAKAGYIASTEVSDAQRELKQFTLYLKLKPEDRAELLSAADVFSPAHVNELGLIDGVTSTDPVESNPTEEPHA